LTDRYNYSALKRTNKDGKRHYTTPEGLAVPSVTTVLSKTAPKEKMIALANWKKRVGEAKAQQITTEAASRGTRMHKYLEDHVNGQTLKESVSNPFAQQSLKMAKIVIKEGLKNCQEYWGVEVPLYFPKVYAGTTDCVGIHNNKPSIMDFKQTNKPKKKEWIQDYFLQLAAYAEAHNEVHGTKINRGVILMCSAEYKYQEFLVEGKEFDHWRDQWWKRVEQYYQQLT